MKYLIWDFDGTLGYRKNDMWSGTLLEIIHQNKPGFNVTIEQIQPYMQSGFPWNNPTQPHTEIRFADQWWDSLDEHFAQAFLGVGIEPSEVRQFAKQVRRVYLDLSAWCLYEDVIPTLEHFSAAGWMHLILSNHVPELQQITHHLGLDKYITRIFNSAQIGYEKPHPQSFRMVLSEIDTIEKIWMIGDNMEADILGAKTAGIPGVLVRKSHPDATYYYENLNLLSKAFLTKSI